MQIIFYMTGSGRNVVLDHLNTLNVALKRMKEVLSEKSH